MKTTYFEDIKVGARFGSSRVTITETHIVLFAGLTGDFNPMHMDAEAAKNTRFGRVIAHGMLCASISSGLRSPIDDWAVIAMVETGRKFLRPVFAGDTVGFLGEVIEMKDSKTKPDMGVVKISVTLANQDNVDIQTGVDTLFVARRRVEGS